MPDGLLVSFVTGVVEDFLEPVIGTGSYFAGLSHLIFHFLLMVDLVESQRTLSIDRAELVGDQSRYRHSK